MRRRDWPWNGMIRMRASLLIITPLRGVARNSGGKILACREAWETRRAGILSTSFQALRPWSDQSRRCNSFWMTILQQGFLGPSLIAAFLHQLTWRADARRKPSGSSLGLGRPSGIALLLKSDSCFCFSAILDARACTTLQCCVWRFV